MRRKKIRWDAFARPARGLEHTRSFKDDPGVEDEQPKVQAPPIVPTTPPPGPSADARRIAELEAAIEKERKAREKLEAEKAAADDAKKSELERAQDAAKSETAKREGVEARLETLIRTNALRDAAAAGGAKADRLGAIMRVIDQSGITSDESGNLSGVDAAIASAKADFPEFFGSGTTAGPGVGGGKGGDRNEDGGDDEIKNDYDLGRALARVRKEKKTRL